MSDANDVVLIACSSTKLKTATPVPAAELYQGELFKAHLAYARQVLGAPDGRIFILSAKYGLIRSDLKMYPYDLSLDKMSADERRRWGMGVAYLLGMVTGLSGRSLSKAFVMGGKYYRQAIEDALALTNKPVVVPHPVGLGYAQQVAWYKARVQEVA